MPDTVTWKSILDYSNSDFSLNPSCRRMDKSLATGAYRHFLTLLQEARQQAGLTQVQVADRLHETQSFVSKVERGERRLDVVEWLGWCDALGVDPHVFLRDFQGAG
jgi:DNA-binding transcriptional regulator YiaG